MKRLIPLFILICLSAPALAIDTITVTDFSDLRVFQRTVGGTSATITISGTKTGADEAIDARVVQDGTSTEVVTWTQICTSNPGGTFSGTLSVPQGGWYNVQVRGHTSTGVTSNGSNAWGVGIIIVMAGQSKMATGCGQTIYDVWYGGTEVGDEHTSQYSQTIFQGSYAWRANDGNLAVAFADAIHAALDIPVGLLVVAQGGSGLRCGGVFSETFGCWLGESGHYAGFQTELATVGGSAEIVVWDQGETDAWDYGSYDYYLADLATIYGMFEDDLYTGVPFLVASLGRTLETYATDAEWDNIYRAQKYYATNTTNIYWALINTDLAINTGENTHLLPAAMTTAGVRLAQTAKYILGEATYYRGPTILGFERISLTKLRVYIDHNSAATDFTPASSINGFSILNDSTPVTVSSADRYDFQSIDLTTPSTSWGTTVTVRYLYGNNPAGTSRTLSGCVYDNSTLTLPLEPATTTTERDAPEIPASATSTGIGGTGIGWQ